MAIKKIFPIADTTLYSRVSTTNTGIDEMLEIGTYNNKSGKLATNLVLAELNIDDIRRTLIQFNQNDIKDTLTQASQSIALRDQKYNTTTSINIAPVSFSGSQLIVDGVTASFYGTYIGASGTGSATFSYSPGQIITGSVIANDYSASNYSSTSSYTATFAEGDLIPSGVVALHSGTYLTPIFGILVSQSFVSGTIIAQEAYASSFVTASSSVVVLPNMMVDAGNLIPASATASFETKYTYTFNSFPVTAYYASGAIVTSGSYAIEYYSASVTQSGFYGDINYVNFQLKGFSGSSTVYNYITGGFSGSYLSQSIENNTSSFDTEARLRLFLATADNLTTTYTVEAHPISQQWANGLGKYVDAPTNTEGASWDYRSSRTVGNRWNLSNNSVTQSFKTRGGGAWYSNYLATQSFTFASDKDVNLDVTRIVSAWITGSGNTTYRPNFGFIVKFPFQSSYILTSSIQNLSYAANEPIGGLTASFAGTYYTLSPTTYTNYSASEIMPSNSFAFTSTVGGVAFSGTLLVVQNATGSEQIYEANAQSYNGIKFYSMDTHTIYPPCLEVKWDDYSFRTGSSYVTASDDSYVVLCNNNLGKYQGDTSYRFNIRVRDRYPKRDFTTSSAYLDWKYLPQESSYAIQDYKTKEMVYDFDSKYTKLSVDEQGSYFNLDMNGLQPERSYKILIKSTLQTGETLIKDEDLIFKVIR